MSGRLVFAYRKLSHSRLVNCEKMDFIREGGGAVSPQASANAFRWDHVWKLLRFRQIWGVCLGKLAATTTLYFFLTWFATYLMQAPA